MTTGVQATQRRGLSYAEAMAYVGVKRRTFDEKWRPHLVAIPAGSSLIFDRADLDRLFEQFKAEAAGASAANDSDAALAHNAPRNGRPTEKKGEFQWAKRHGGFTPKTGSGVSTSGGEAFDFAAAASLVSKKRKAG